MDNKSNGVGIQKLMALVRNHEKERHVSENVPIGERNPIFFNLQGPALEEWYAADDADVDDKSYVENDAAING